MERTSGDRSAANAAHCVLGDHVQVLSHASVNHDVFLADYVIVASGAAIASRARVLNDSYVGAGSSIRQGATVGPRSVVGMGAVVIRDVAANAVVVGSPARFLRHVVGENETGASG